MKAKQLKEEEVKFKELIDIEKKDINWSINYHEEKLIYYKMKLKKLDVYN